jgi:hypothetical protein
MKITGIVALTIILLFASHVFSAASTSITGQITDSEGAALAQARVLIHWDSAGSTVGLSDNIGIRRDVIVRTDPNGNFSATVPPGFYDLFVSSMAFTPIAAKVRVKTGHSSTFNGKLFADPLVGKELDHKIYSAP